MKKKQEVGAAVEFLDKKKQEIEKPLSFLEELNLLKMNKDKIIETGTFDFLKNLGINIEQTTYIKHVCAQKLKEDLLERSKKKKINWRTLKTINILNLCEEQQLFGKKYLEFLQDERKEELFSNILEFVNSREVKDELYYWEPGKKVTNIFSFLKILLPNFAQLYKIYLSRCFTTNVDPVYPDSFLREKINKVEYEEIEMLFNDREIFKNKYITRPEWLEYWDEKLDFDSFYSYQYNNFASSDYKNFDKTHFEIHPLNFLEKIPDIKSVSEDLECELVDELSFVNFNIDNVEYLMSLKEFKRRFM
ncbi:hypothetical protein EHP00_970 [Ecytonucleospora hepatopenaei]|uniref:Uncharacterized protein n=1 Tax=Ecytonucleospora hepatopenaei TaxID=646526 RepID=A0A1W0E6N8_9MICR|nr:hypothetical protein EHP00_970 [Ecytonucleospora hepatopenaei]